MTTDELRATTEELLERMKRLEDYLRMEVKTVLTTEEVCLYTGLSKKTIHNLTHYKRIPYYKPTGKLIYFDKAEIEQWMRQNRVEPRNHS